MGIVPTIQLVRTVAAPQPTLLPGGLPVVGGSWADDFDISGAPFMTCFDELSGVSGYPITTACYFDPYEDGVQMVDGRIFQVSAYLFSNPGSDQFLAGPHQSVSRTTTPQTSSFTVGCFDRINIPVVYSTANNRWTCFNLYEDGGLMTAEAWFMRGTFLPIYQRQPISADRTEYNDSNEAFGIAYGHIPLFVDSADLVGTSDPGISSTDEEWSLASPIRQVAGTYPQIAMTPCRSYKTLTTPYYTNERPALSVWTQRVSFTPSVGVALQRGKINMTNTVRGTVTPGDVLGVPRCYRRLGSSATYDWRGWTIY